MTMLATQGLTVGYGRDVVIDEVRLTFMAGQVSVLIGPNGSGKSTLLRTIAAQLEPLRGSVAIAMRQSRGTGEADSQGGEGLADIARVPSGELARHMASLFTDNRRPELLTCREVVETGRYPHTGALGRLGAADRDAVARAMEAVGIAGLAETDIARISDGQRQRVLLARAIAQGPSVLVLDEPTSFLDVRHQFELLDVLRRLAHEQGLCVVMSLHELACAQRAADQVIAVRDGRVAAVGSPEEVFARETIDRLYGLEGSGLSFDPAFGSVELPSTQGDAQVFVVAGAGTGAGTFRRLHRAGVPFAAGVLHEGDVDCALARDLGARVVAMRAFEPIDDDAFARAAALLDAVAQRGGELVDCRPPYGAANARNRELLELAACKGMRVRTT